MNYHMNYTCIYLKSLPIMLSFLLYTHMYFKEFKRKNSLIYLLRYLLYTTSEIQFSLLLLPFMIYYCSLLFIYSLIISSETRLCMMSLHFCLSEMSLFYSWSFHWIWSSRLTFLSFSLLKLLLWFLSSMALDRKFVSVVSIFLSV